MGVLVNWGLLLCGVFWVTLAYKTLQRQVARPPHIHFSSARLTLDCVCGKNDWDGSVYTALERREGEMKPVVRRIEARCNACREKIKIELGARK